MIDPNNPYFYDAPESKLEEFFLFCVFVCNKNAIQTAAKLDKFFNFAARKEIYGFIPEENPFKYVHALILSGQLEDRLKEVKTGQYRRIVNALTKILEFQKPLSEITFEELISINGIGMKTAAFFLTYTRKNFKMAILDTHLLAYLSKALTIEIPKSTPSKPKLYKKLSDDFLLLCKSCDINPADADINIWKYFSGKPDFDTKKIPFFDNLLGDDNDI